MLDPTACWYSANFQVPVDLVVMVIIIRLGRANRNVECPASNLSSTAVPR